LALTSKQHELDLGMWIVRMF